MRKIEWWVVWKHGETQYYAADLDAFDKLSLKACGYMYLRLY